MALAQKTIGYCMEMDRLIQLLVKAIVDVKAGKDSLQVGSDLLPSFISALSGITELKLELADRKDLERTVALNLCDLIDAIMPV